MITGPETLGTSESISQNYEWQTVPKVLTDELENLPWKYLLGQGLLLRSQNVKHNLTMLVSVAEAAVFCWDPIDCAIFECLLWAVEASMIKSKHKDKSATFEFRLKRPDGECSLLTNKDPGSGIWRLSLSNMSTSTVCRMMEWLLAIFEPAHIEPPPQNKYPFEKTRQAWPSTKLQNEQHQGGCWRRKIEAGNVIYDGPKRKSNVNDIASAILPLFDIKEFPPDPLILSAAALWSLFDDALIRMQDCSCTFRHAESKVFLSCENEVNGVLFWHVQGEKDICGGRMCDNRPRVNSQGFDPRTVCILGWPAMIRSSPDRMIALPGNLAISKKFKEKVTKPLDTITTQLGLAGVVGINFLVGSSFALQRYRVSNSLYTSVPEDTTISSVVLVYCETRKIHLAIRGADLIEVIVMQWLRQVGFRTQNPPEVHKPSK